jgi:glyoxylase-like metal-dependent hydrolase (beta-lactamase superfamily II)
VSDVRIDHGITSGTFSLDGETFDVDNNVWVVGDDADCLVIDAPHNVEAILDVVDGRRVLAILCSHAHDDHVRVAPALAERVSAPVMLHSGDLPLWELVHPEVAPDANLVDGKRVSIAGSDLEVVHTPGHSPGGVCFYSSTLGVVFTGDTLFQGGPGATGRSYSDYEALVTSIRTKLFALPRDTVVHPGHGDSTTIREELF